MVQTCTNSRWGRGTTYSALEAVEVESAIQGTDKLTGKLLATFFARTHLAAGRAAAPLSRSISLGALARQFIGPGGVGGQRSWTRIGVREPQLVGAIGSLSASGLPGLVTSLRGRVTVGMG